MAKPLTEAPKYRKFIVDYYHEGAYWSVLIFASSWEDAQARVKQLQYAKLTGEWMAEIPAILRPLARLMCWFRNLFAQANA